MEDENGGLLGFLKTPAGQGLLGTVFGGLAGARRGQPLSNLGRAGLAGALAYGYGAHRDAQAAQNAPALELQKMQLQHTKDQYAQEKDINSMASQFYRQGTPGTPEVLGSYGVPGTVGVVGSPAIPATPAGFSTKQYLDAIAAKYPLKALEMRKSMQKDPMKLGRGDSLVTESGEVIYQSPPPDDLPTKVQEFLWAQKNNGYKGTFEDYVGLNANIVAGAQQPFRDASIENIGAENNYNLPQPGVVVRLPNGKSVRFKDQKSANKFKFEAGIK